MVIESGSKVADNLKLLEGCIVIKTYVSIMKRIPSEKNTVSLSFKPIPLLVKKPKLRSRAWKIKALQIKKNIKQIQIRIPSIARPQAVCSSGIWAALNWSEDKKSTPPTTHHHPPDKRYTFNVRISPKILKPTNILEGISFVKLRAISIFWITFKRISFLKSKTS